MKEEKEITEVTIEIPGDMSIDVLAVIVKEKLKHEIIRVIENRSLIVVVISYDKNLSRHQNILSDIRNMIEDYDNFRSGELEGVDWRGRPL